MGLESFSFPGKPRLQNREPVATGSQTQVEWQHPVATALGSVCAIVDLQSVERFK